MAEITGGELNYAVTVDVDQLKKGMSDAEGKLEGFSDVAEKTGEKLDNALKGNVVENLKKIGVQSGLTGRDMKDALKEADDFIKVLNSGLKEAIKVQDKLLDEIYNLPAGNAQSLLIEDYAQGEKDLQNITEAVKAASDVVQKFKDDNASLQVKLRLVKEEMQQLIKLGQKDSEKYSELSAKAKEYTQNIDQLNAEMKALGGNPGLDLLVESLGLAAGVFATTQGVMGLLAGESENLDKIMLRMQATMSVAIGLQQIQNALKRDGSVITRVLAIQDIARARATDIGTAATGRAAVAQRLWNLVANANPYILLGTAILTVVGAIALYSVATSKAEKSSESLAELNKKIADSVVEPLVAYKSLQAQWNSLANDLKAKEKFIKDNKDVFNGLGYEINNVNDAEKFLVANAAAVINVMMLKAKAAAQLQLAQEKYKESLSMDAELDQQDATYKKGAKTVKIENAVKNFFGFGSTREREKEQRDNAEQYIKDANQTNTEIQNALNKIPVPKYDPNKAKVKPSDKPKTKDSIADEYFPPGSVAEIQKRMAVIDEALSKATNSGAIEALKNKRIAITEELVEALKRIEIKSLEDRANEQEKYNVAYSIIAEKYGKEAADKMYGDLIKGSGSYLSYLEQERKALEEKQGKGLLTTQEKEDLDFAITKLDEYANIKSKQDTWKNDLTDSLRGVVLISDQIDIVEKKKAEIFAKEGNSIPFLNFSKDADNQIEGFIGQQKEMYQSFLNEHQNYEEQKTAIADKYNELRSQAKTPEEKKKIDKAEKSETSQLEIGFLKESDDWKMAFGDIELFTQNTIQRILANLIKYRDEKKGSLQPTEERELAEAISRLQAAANRNPFIKIIEGLKSMKTARIAVINAEKEYQAILAANGGNAKTEEAIAAYKKLTKAEQDAADKKKAFISGVQETQAIFNAVGEGVLELGDAFGGMSDATKDAIGDIMAIGNAAMDFAISLASGDVAGMIKAGVKIITSVFNALSGDKKKERQIKQQAAVLKELETAYNNVAFAAERMFGAQKYDGQRDLIKNLQEQKIAIESMMRLEQEKKKGDKDKIEGYQSQIQGINESIITLKEGIIKDVLQTDIPDMASKLGDALLDAFSKGESGVDAINRAFDDLVKNMLRNQLNKILEKDMDKVLANITAAMGFGRDGTGSFNELTPEEIADLRAQVQAATAQGQQFIDAYSQVFEGLDSPSEGLKGDIKGITEKTAGALEAQVNALRTYIAEGLNIQRSNQAIFVSCLQNLVLIEANTRNLIQIRQDISDMNGKMGKGLAGL